jgi:hypothetical protein
MVARVSLNLGHFDYNHEFECGKRRRVGWALPTNRNVRHAGCGGHCPGTAHQHKRKTFRRRVGTAHHRDTDIFPILF